MMISKTRLEAFSDGVFAILITILVLEFHVPNYHQGHLAQAIVEQWPEFLAYIVSYFYVGTLWLFHHDYFVMLKAIDRNMNLINLLSMFSVTLLDYPMSLVATALAGRNEADIRVAFMIYSAVAFMISAVYYLMYYYLAGHQELLDRDHFVLNFRIKRDPIWSMILYGLAIISSMWNIWVGGLLLLAGIIFHFIAYLHLSRIRRRNAA
ncbi:TMEM175 family protein [Furfurilactobacillus sp. WILCCON 0119]